MPRESVHLRPRETLKLYEKRSRYQTDPLLKHLKNRKTESATVRDCPRLSSTVLDCPRLSATVWDSVFPDLLPLVLQTPFSTAARLGITAGFRVTATPPATAAAATAALNI